MREKGGKLMRLSLFLFFFRVFDKINVRVFAYIKRNAYLCNVIKNQTNN